MKIKDIVLMIALLLVIYGGIAADQKNWSLFKWSTSAIALFITPVCLIIVIMIFSDKEPLK